MTLGISASHMSSAFDGLASAFSKRMQKKVESPDATEIDIVATQNRDIMNGGGPYMPRDSMGYSTTRSDSEMAIYWYRRVWAYNDCQKLVPALIRE